MATFTTISRNALDWQAPPPEEQTGQAYELLIGNTYKLDIGSGFNLTIQPATVAIQWTQTGKTISHAWPAPTASEVNYLTIGDTYELLIGGGFKLRIGNGRGDTPWTEVTKTNVGSY